MTTAATRKSIKDVILASMPKDYEFIPVGDPIAYGSINKNAHAAPSHMLGKTVHSCEFWLRPIVGSHTWALQAMHLGNAITGEGWQMGHTIREEDGYFIESYPGTTDNIAINFGQYVEGPDHDQPVVWRLADVVEKVSLKKLRKEFIATGDAWFVNPSIENAKKHKLAIEKYRNAPKGKKCKN